jgi:hypothetical protein
MSFEIARAIVQSYRQTNQERIKSSMEMAYQEAFVAFQSEQKAREAAIDVLENETKLFDTMLKNIEKSRQQIIQGNSKIAKENLNREFYNQKEKVAYQDRLTKEKIDAQQAELNREYRQSNIDLQREGVRAQRGLAVDDKLSKAQDYATARVLTHDLYSLTVADSVDKIKEQLENGEPIERIAPTISGDLSKGINRYFSESQKTQAGLGDKATRKDLVPYRKSDLAHQIINDLRANETPQNREVLRTIEDWLHGDLQQKTLGLNASQGKLKEGKTISPQEVERKYQEQVQLRYRNLTGEKLGAGTSLPRPIVPGRIGRPVRPPVYKEMLEGTDTTIGRELRKIAQPVFEALRNDFEITAEEQEKLPAEAVEAYNKLKEVIIDNPLAVTREEQVLLDDLALERQYNILQQKRKVASIQPEMKSAEEIQGRAADLAEPTQAQRFDPTMYSPSEQKYMATEQKAYELSNKRDNDIKSMGVPEKFGLSLFAETFDKQNKTYIENQNFDSILSRLETEFEGRPEEQLRALAVYNSRAMALQRASNPIILSDGQTNPDYTEALRRLTPKE